MKSRLRCVIFDLDDTLYLERDYVRSGFTFVSEVVNRQFGVNSFLKIAWDLFESGIRGQIFDRSLEMLGIKVEEETIGNLVTAYREHRPTITLTEDSQRLIDRLGMQNIRLAVISDGPRQSQRNKSDALGLSKLMSPIILTDELGIGLAKPDPAAFRRIEEETALKGANCCYIADNPAKDFLAPKTLGWLTVRIRRPLSLHAEITSGHDVEFEITNFDQLIGHI